MHTPGRGGPTIVMEEEAGKKYGHSHLCKGCSTWQRSCTLLHTL